MQDLHCADELLRRFAEAWFIDTEFNSPEGERQTPVCLVAYELRSQRTVRLWQDVLRGMRRPPFETGKDRLFIAYYAVAEVSTFLALGWVPPVNILDLFVEFRNATNGLVVPHGNGLLSALEFHGLPSMGATDKDAGRNLFIHQTTWSDSEKRRGLDYCEADARCMVGLLERMWPRIHLDDGLLRGAYMRALATVEWESTPLDRSMYERLGRNWSGLKRAMIEQVDPDYGVYAGTRFVSALFEAYLRRYRIMWPRLATGALALDKATFKDMARLHPQLNALHELRSTLSKARLTELRIGSDGRNRCSLSAFRTITSRNAPRASQFIFGPATWLRSLIQAPPGYGVAYCDWSGQEIGLGAALANDDAMMEDYRTGDPYAAFARRGGLIPPDGTKESHPIIRDQCKVLELGLNYGMSDFGLAHRLDTSEAEARWLADRHRQAYPRFWDYVERVVHTGAQGFTLHSRFGFRRHIGPNVQPRSLRNWPMQTNGAEMLRIATVAGIDAGLTIVALVHDALLILAPLAELEHHVAVMQAIMIRASETVTGGFPLRVDTKLIRHPDRYRDPRGVELWDRAMVALADLARSRDTRDAQAGTEESEEADTEAEGLASFTGEWR